MAKSTIQRWAAGRFAPQGANWGWNYELGTLLEGMDTVPYNTADRTYYNYVKQSVDQFVGAGRLHRDLPNRTRIRSTTSSSAGNCCFFTV